MYYFYVPWSNRFRFALAGYFVVVIDDLQRKLDAAKATLAKRVKILPTYMRNPPQANP
jgi:hypothetical protein